MKKLLVAVAAFSAFALYSFSTAVTTDHPETFLNQCTNASMITPDFEVINNGQDLLFTWNGTSLLYNGNYTYSTQLSATECNTGNTTTVTINDFFNNTQQTFPGGLFNNPSASDDCFTYNLVITGSVFGSKQCLTFTGLYSHE